jgi:hypothetical protein
MFIIETRGRPQPMFNGPRDASAATNVNRAGQ